LFSADLYFNCLQVTNYGHGQLVDVTDCDQSPKHCTYDYTTNTTEWQKGNVCREMFHLLWTSI